MVAPARSVAYNYRVRLWQQSCPYSLLMLNSSITFFQVLAWIILAFAGMSFVGHVFSILKADQANRRKELNIMIPVFVAYLLFWPIIVLQNEHIAWAQGTNLISHCCVAIMIALLIYADRTAAKFNRQGASANQLVQGV